MSCGKHICCDLCGYKFKVYKVIETHYHDYEPCEEERWYPSEDDPNPAHLVKNYICDRCYKKFGEKVLGVIKERSKGYTNGLVVRKEALKKEYERKLRAVEEENKDIELVLEELENYSNFSDMPTFLINKLKSIDKSTISFYYLLDAIYFDNKIDLRKGLNIKFKINTISHWCFDYHVEIIELPKGYSMDDMVSLLEFEALVQTSKLYFCFDEKQERKEILQHIHNDIDVLFS